MRQTRLKKYHYLFFLLYFLAPDFLFGCQSPTPLNSERIEQQFGNYGIDVLKADAHTRISNLYSQDVTGTTMRTLAIVDFTGATDSRLSVEHDRIVAGESIGSVFRESGWKIEKATLEVCEKQFDLRIHPQLQLMNIELPDTLAFRRYVFRVSNDDDAIDYAIITEIHHPDYLTIADLTTSVGQSRICDYNQP